MLIETVLKGRLQAAKTENILYTWGQGVGSPLNVLCKMPAGSVSVVECCSTLTAPAAQSGLELTPPYSWEFSPWQGSGKSPFQESVMTTSLVPIVLRSSQRDRESKRTREREGERGKGQRACLYSFI